MPILDAHGRPMVLDQPDERADAWANGLTGLGVWGLDKTKAATYLPPWRILDQELTSLVNGSDIAAKIVWKRPQEMFRRGYEIEADNVKSSERDDLREYATEYLDLETNLRNAKGFGRQYGGCLLVMGIDDGRHPWEPLDEDNIRSFDSLALVDRRYSYVQSQYAAMGGSTAKYGRAQVYLISNAVAGYGWNSYGVEQIEKIPGRDLLERGAQVALVHETRCLRFDGNETDIVTRQQLAGWTWSVLQRVYDSMRQFRQSFDSAGYLLSDASQGVLKIQGLFKAIAAGQRGALAARALLADQTRSVMRSLVLDAGTPDGKGAEDFKREPTSFTGIPELLDRMILIMSAAADMPATELFGRAPAGLNATGESDTRKWYDTIETEAKNDVSPQVRRIFKLLALAKQGPLGGRKVRWKVKWHPLWSPTDKELAETRLANAQRDDIYLEQGVVKPEEVAVDLSDVYPNLDVEAREEVLAAGVKFDPYENEPSPDTSAVIAGQTEGEPLSPEAPVSLYGTTGTQITPGALPAVQAAAGAGGAKPAAPTAKPKTGTKKPAGRAPKPRTVDAGAQRAPAKANETKADAAAATFEVLLAHRSDAAAASAVFAALLEDYRAALRRSDSADDTARKVYLQLGEDYPTKLLGWVLAAHWEGPHEVPLADIDDSNRDRWTASHDGRLQSFVDKINEGVRKPAILVQVPSNPKWKITDGHHRYLGNEAAGKPTLLAYTAKMHTSAGPWDTLHDAQRSGKSGPSDAGPSWRTLVDPSYVPDPSLIGATTADAHDPKRARGAGGRWSEEAATSASRDAVAASDVARLGDGPATHLEAARAHATAAFAHRELAARHESLGNKSAAKKHVRAAAGHDQQASAHLLAVTTPTDRRADANKS